MTLLRANLPYGMTIYPGIANPALCKELIRYFDTTPKPPLEHKINGKPFSFTYLGIDEENLQAHRAIQVVYRRIRRQVDRYLDNYIAGPELREEFKQGILSLQPRMKKYSAGGDFPLHSDDSSLASQLRRFAYILYLNDDFKGGHTVFRSGYSEVARITPEQGALAVFPVHPVFMHEGEPVTEGSKYILNGFVETMVSQARASVGGVPVSKLEAVNGEIEGFSGYLLQMAERVFGGE